MSTKRKADQNVEITPSKRHSSSDSSTQILSLATTVFLLTILQLPVEILLHIAGFCESAIPFALTSKDMYSVLRLHRQARQSLLLLNPLLFMVCFPQFDAPIILAILRAGLLVSKSILADNIPHIIQQLKPFYGDLFSILNTKDTLLPDENILNDFYFWSDPDVNLDNYNLNWLFYGIAQDSFQLVLYYLKNNSALVTEENLKALIDLCFFNRKWKCLLLFFSDLFHQNFDTNLRLRLVVNVEYFVIATDEIFYEFEDDNPQISAHSTKEEIRSFKKQISESIFIMPMTFPANKVKLESWDDHKLAFENLLDKLFEFRTSPWMIFAILCLFKSFFAVTNKDFVQELVRVDYPDPVVREFFSILFQETFP